MARRGLSHPSRPDPPRRGGGLFDSQGDGEDGRKVLTVSELTRRIKQTLEGSFEALWVKGELSNVSRPRSGHVYLTLKDEGAQVSAVVWRSLAQRLRFEMSDGDEVLVFARITVYEPRGNYQLIVERVEPVGLGALQKAFEQLKARLSREGLFDPERKRPIPELPECIGIVTSPTGAAIQDMLNVIARRFPPMRVILAPVKVQGKGAADEIARAIEDLNRSGLIDVMIVGRGGGSLEDLWAFNEEIVARAIAASDAPVISAVGHETDFTIADMVADLRALTPSEAAERVVPRLDELTARLAELALELRRLLVRGLEDAHTRLEGLARSYALRHPADRVQMERQRIDELAGRLVTLASVRLALEREHVAVVAGRLEALSPLRVLERGYSVTMDAKGGILRDARSVKPGERIQTRLHDGRLSSRVEEA